MVREGSDARHGHCPDTIRRDGAGWVLDALDPVEAGLYAGQHGQVLLSGTAQT